MTFDFETVKDALIGFVGFVAERAPLFGVFAFSACSVHAMAHFLLEHAKNDTPLYWIASVLIELATAWLATRIIEQVREATRSVGGRYGITKQDRRFALFALCIYVPLVVPSFTASVVANHVEFGENLLLAFLFPVLTVACAVGSAMPGVIAARKTKKKAEETTTKREEEIKKAEQDEQSRAEMAQRIVKLGRTADVLRQLIVDPTQTRADLATAMGVAPQTISYHLSKLEEEGLIDRRDGQTMIVDGVEELLEVEHG